MFQCSHCNHKFSNIRQLNGHKRMHGPSLGKVNRTRTDKLKKCLCCGNTKNTRYKSKNPDFCSKKCHTKYKWETEGILSVVLGNGPKEDIIRYFKEENLYHCHNCNINQWQGKKLNLKLIYIDKNKNNKLTDNISFLCPNCYDANI